MRTTLVFVVGLLFGTAIATTFAQGNKLAPGNKIAGVDAVNHVAISLENFDEGFAFYTQKMGFPEVLTQRNDKGDVMFAFVQVSRDTFLELAPANANRPPGLTHFGLQVNNMASTLATLKERGVPVTESRSVGNQWLLGAATGPGNLRIELSELGPESPLKKAGSAWK